MEKPVPKFLPYLALVCGILALSLSSFFIRWSEAPGTVTSFFRMTVASLALLPFYVRLSNKKRFPGKCLLWLPVLGGLFVALDHATWSTALGLTTIATATLLNNIAPLWVGLFSLLIWRQGLHSRFWFGLGLTLIGATLIFGGDLVTNTHFTGGNVLGLISSFFYGGYYLVTQRARSRFSTLAYIWPVICSAAIFLLTINLVMQKSLTGYPPLTYLAFLGAGLISQIIGYFSVGFALGHLPAALVAPTMIIQPVLTSFMAIPLAHEPLRPAQWLGGAIVLTGIYLVNQTSGQG